MFCLAFFFCFDSIQRTFENECPDFEREQEACEYVSLAAGTARAATDVTDYCSRAV